MTSALKRLHWKRATLLLLIAGGAAFATQTGARGEGGKVIILAQNSAQPFNHRTVMVEQILPSRRPSPTKIEPVPHRPVRGKDAASTTQLPSDLRAASDDPDQETGLTSPDTASPDLMSEVARAWYVIRSRGQQPTPELIAREIGPDMLTAFLNQYPNGVALITSQDPPSAPSPVVVVPNE